MSRKIAVIGAGLSGLAAAKASLECGLAPTIFEKADTVGGLWSAGTGFVWPDMRTNLSRWTCAFSDHLWPEQSDDYPKSEAVEKYLLSYAGAYGLHEHISLRQRVSQILPKDNGWEVFVEGQKPQQFCAVMVAGGVFNRPFTPSVVGRDTFKGQRLHSSAFRSMRRDGRRAIVVGASLSGIEIASQLAAAGSEVVILFTQAPWILPRYVRGAGRNSVPLDLFLYRRKEGDPSDANLSVEQKNRRSAAFLEQTFGDPGRYDPVLRPLGDGRPNFVGISDSFLQHVETGAIVPIQSRLKEIGASHVETEAGQRFSAEHIIFCTGYEADLSFLSDSVRSTLCYDPQDRLLPFIAQWCLLHPALPGLFFIGVYKGPYFGVVELQARLAARIASGLAGMPADACIALDGELDIRLRRPRPQFPHGDYVSFSDDLAEAVGVAPKPSLGDSRLARAVSEGSVTPAQFRLSGPNANPAVAASGVLSAWERSGG